MKYSVTFYFQNTVRNYAVESNGPIEALIDAKTSHEKLTFGIKEERFDAVIRLEIKKMSHL